MVPKPRQNRPTRPERSAHARVCPGCGERRTRSAFPPDERPDRDDVMRDPGSCVSCLQAAREVERGRRARHGAVDAWARRRLAEEQAILEPWSGAATCAHCARLVPQSSAYVWSCRRGFGAGACEGLIYPHVHSVCRSCAYEGLYDLSKGDGTRRIA